MGLGLGLGLGLGIGLGLGLGRVGVRSRVKVGDYKIDRRYVVCQPSSALSKSRKCLQIQEVFLILTQQDKEKASQDLSKKVGCVCNLGGVSNFNQVRQRKTGSDTRQDKTKNGKTIQDKIMHDTTRQHKTT